MTNGIAFRDDKDVSAGAIHALFKRNQWNDYLSRKDVEWYLDHALYVASAWRGRRAVGVATLVGDGRISIELDTLLVDEPFHRQGIGQTLIGMAVKQANARRPYHFKVEVFEESTEQLYAKFGFVKNDGTWLLYHEAIHQRIRRKTGR